MQVTKLKNNEFAKLVKSIQKTTSQRIFASDIENGMCELDRDRRGRRKQECIFFQPSNGNIQNFFRIHKTNISKHKSVCKYQVQFLNKNKWICVEKNMVLLYKIWSDENNEKSVANFTCTRVEFLSFAY